MKPITPRLLAAAFLLLFVGGIARLASDIERVARDSDYAVFAAAGRTVASGRGADLYEPRAQRAALGALVPGRVKYFFNPPPVALAFAVLAETPLLAGFCAWDVLSLAALLLALAVILSEWGPRDRDRRWLLGSALLAFEPTYHNLRFGNFEAFLLLLTVLFLREMSRGRDARAGGILAALLVVKPHLFLLPAAVLLARRRWRAVAACGAGVAVLLAVSLVAVGGAGLVGWLRISGEAAQGFNEIQRRQDVLAMVNWRALSLRATGGEGPYDVVTLALTVAALALLYAAYRRSRVDGPDSGAIWALAMLAGILAAPHVYLQSLILLAPAALWAAGLVRQARAWRHLEALAVAAVGVSWWANVDHAVGLPALQILLTAIFFAAAGRLVLTGSTRQAAPARSSGQADTRTVGLNRERRASACC